MKNVTKTIQTRPEYYIQFTEDELVDFGLEPGDKFTTRILPNDEGIIFEKLAKLDIDLDEFTPEILKKLVGASLQRDLPINDIIVEALESYMDENE